MTAGFELHGADFSLGVSTPAGAGARNSTGDGETADGDPERVAGGAIGAGVIDVYVVGTGLVDLQCPGSVILRAMPHADVFEWGFESGTAAEDFRTRGRKEEGFAGTGCDEGRLVAGKSF